jgi:hypothetical protein
MSLHLNPLGSDNSDHTEESLGAIAPGLSLLKT